MRRLIQLLIVFLVVMYCSYFYAYIYGNVFPVLKPLYWYMMTIVFASVIAILRLPALLPKDYMYFIAWVLVYLCYCIFNYLYSSQSDNAEQYLVSSLEMSALFMAFVIIFQFDDSIRVVRLAMIMVVILSVIMNLIDFVMPLWSKVPGRAAGFYENPTISGKMLVLMMVAGLPLIPQKFRLIYCLVAGFGVLVTFSRGPWLLWVLAMIGLASIGYFVFRRKMFSIFFVGVLSVTVLFLLLTGSMLEYVSGSGVENYLTPNTVARLGGGVQAFTDISTQSRIDVIAKAWEVFQNYPWFGAGMGYTRGEWGTRIGAHNMYLTMAAEGGFLGIAVFVSLLAVLFYMGDGIGRVLTVVYAASSIGTHNNLDQPAILIILAFIVVSNKLQETGITKQIRSR